MATSELMTVAADGDKIGVNIQLGEHVFTYVVEIQEIQYRVHSISLAQFLTGYL